MNVRTERTADHAAVRALNIAAFDGPAEADLVDLLRERAPGCISLVADTDGRVAGHLMLSPATIDGHADAVLMGLAPMAVLPELQRGGIGSALVRDALARCTAAGVGAVIVLGHPGYYPRFGFVPASRFGLTTEYDAPDEAFMAIETTPGGLTGRSGLARYHPAFAELP